MNTQAKENAWSHLKTEETRKIENALLKQFQEAEVYRHDSGSIRIRIIDEAFEGKTQEERDQLVDPILEKLPKRTQARILLLLTLTPDEIKNSGRWTLLNLEFVDPSPSRL